MFSSSFHWDSLLPLWKNSCRWVDYHMSSSSTVSSCNRCFQRNRVMMCVQLQLRSTSCLWALVSGEAYLPVRGASRGPALSLQLQWNNYDWCAETSSQEYLLYYLFSQSPGSGGENTYKLPASLLSSSLTLLLAEVLARSLSFIPFFSFFVVLSSEMRRREHPSGPWGLNSLAYQLWTHYTCPHLYYFFYLISCCFFGLVSLHTTGVTQFYQRTTNKS